MHGDHIFGLMGLLASCGLAGTVSEIDIYGPPELENYLNAARKYSQTHLAYPVRVHTVKPGFLIDDGEFRVDCALLKHRVTAHAFRVTETRGGLTGRSKRSRHSLWTALRQAQTRSDHHARGWTHV